MDKIWFLFINGQREGPKSYDELKKDSRLNPDHLVWKQGFENWKKIRDVPELDALFKDENDNKNDNPESLENIETEPPRDELALDMQEPPYFFWLLLVLISIIYVLIQLYK